MGQQHGRNADVVVNHLRLGKTARRIEDLIEVRQRQLPTLYVYDGADLGHKKTWGEEMTLPTINYHVSMDARFCMRVPARKLPAGAANLNGLRASRNTAARNHIQ